ncbi:MAG: trigger factor [Anaerolineae bacterium]
MVNVQTEHLENHTARLTVSIEPERLEKAMRQAARRISQKSRIPGFRPGKAPYERVLSLFGREYVLEEALETLGQEVYLEALEAAGIEPYAPGSLEEIRDEGHTLVFVVPKAPTVELGDYQSIRVEEEPEEVTDERVDRVMEWLRQNQALVEPVDRPAKVGDAVVLEHLVVTVEEDEATASAAADAETAAETASGEEGFDEAAQEDEEPDEDQAIVEHEHDHQVILFDNEDDYYPGFTAQIVGMSAGEEKEFTLTMPEDYGDKNLAGKTLRFVVKVGQVNARTVPEWSDDLAKRISEGKFETMLELRMDVRKNLEQLSKDDARSKVFNQALSQLVEGATVQFPEEMIQDTLSDLLEEFEAERLRPEGVTLKDFLTITGRTEDDLRQMLRETAIERLKAMLVLSAFAAREQIKVTPEEVEAEIDRQSEAFGEHAQVFRRLLASEVSRAQIGSALFSRHTTDRLVAIARGEVTATPQEAETQADTAEGEVETSPVAETVQQDEEVPSATGTAEENQD